MFLSLASTYKRTGSLAIVALLLWLGGFGCSLCCAADANEICCLTKHHSSAQAADATSCNASATCSCCKSAQAERQMALTGDAFGREGAIGCTLLPNRLEGVTAQFRIADTLALQSELPPLFFTLNSAARPASLPDASPPLNRGGTYLRCCVLLI